jgi:hypothetical protein
MFKACPSKIGIFSYMGFFGSYVSDLFRLIAYAEKIAISLSVQRKNLVCRLVDLTLHCYCVETDEF